MASLEDGPHDANNDGSLQVAMDDIMDVITLYKCKFCSFSCGQPADIRQHVQDVHVVQEVKEVEQKDPPPSEPHQVLPLEEPKDTKTIVFDSTGHELQIPEVQNTCDSIIEQPNEQQQVQEDVSLVTEGEGQEEEEAQPIQDSMLEDGFQGGVVECATDTVDLVPAVPQSESTQVGMNRDLTELYLCGQCNLGFDSIESCKSHIVKDHKVSLDDDNEDYDEVSHEVEPGEDEIVDKTSTALPEKVSVGTQVVARRKPGRKRKIKEETPDEKSPVDEVYEEEEVAVIEEHRLHQQVEELDNVDVEDEGRNRRRRKLPSRLTQLYYVGKPISTRRAPPPAKKPRPVPYKLICPKSNCSARFRTAESVDLHLACHKVLVDKGQARESFSCVKCEYFTPQWKVLRMHLWREHSVDTDLFSCDTCDFKSDTLGRVERHAQIHGEARPYVCNECGKGFKQVTQLHNHKMTHVGKSADPEKWYSNKECDICQRNFANQKCLKNHIEIVHSKDKPFLCPYCNHATSRKAVMDLHIRTHTGEKPFKCDMCAYVTGDHNSLRRHRMRHTGEKPYKCKYCNYSAIQAISLKTHLKTKHPGCVGVFACESCAYRTVNEHHFNNHIQDHKNGLISILPASKKPTIVSTSSGVNNNNTFVMSNSTRSVLNKSLLPPLTQAPRQIITYNGQPISAIQIPTGAEIQQAQPVEVDPTQANSMLLSKVANLSMVQGDVNTARIIYTALGALSNKTIAPAVQHPGLQQGLEVASQPTVQSATQDGVTTHTITFHIPQDDNSSDKPQTIHIENMPQVVGETIEVQPPPPQPHPHVGGATIEEGQVLLALQTQGGATGHPQGHLTMEGGEVVYTTTEVPQHIVDQIRQHPESVQHLVCDSADGVTMEVTHADHGHVMQTPTTTMTTTSGPEVVPIDISETTVVEIAQSGDQVVVGEVEGQQAQQEPVMMNLISKDAVSGDTQVQYITIAECTS